MCAINALPFPIYQPAMRIIAGITNAFPAIVTTTFDHQYITGTIVRIDIPPGFGMQQINQQTSPIQVLSDTTFSIAIDTTNYGVFSSASDYPENSQLAQVVPIGEINEMVVCIDLIKRGYQVYRAFEPTHSFDILVIKDGKMLKIEVKTETVLPSGSRCITKDIDPAKFDVLARVANLSEITYEPNI